MNKKLLYFAIIPLLAAGLVAAVYLVNSFVITVNITEPFTVEYAVTNTNAETCADILTWQIGADIKMGNLTIGDSRLICTKITNAAEVDIGYTFSREIVPGDCADAIGIDSVIGTAIGNNAETNAEQQITILADATPIENCEITVSVSRG